jgi:hypothetical protein
VSIVTYDRPQRLAGGFDLPARMTVLPLSSGELALVSPISIDEAMDAAIRAAGEVRYVIAPNLLHHLYVADAMARYPGATLLAPPGLAKKRPDLAVGATLDGPLPSVITESLDVIRLEGAPIVDEFVIFHRATQTLVVTDLVFNVLEPRGLVTRLVLSLVGCSGRLAASRSWLFFVKDRTAMNESLARVLALPFTRVVLAHGENLDLDAKPRLEGALRARFGSLVQSM